MVLLMSIFCLGKLIFLFFLSFAVNTNKDSKNDKTVFVESKLLTVGATTTTALEVASPKFRKFTLISPEMFRKLKRYFLKLSIEIKFLLNCSVIYNL